MNGYEMILSSLGEDELRLAAAELITMLDGNKPGAKRDTDFTERAGESRELSSEPYAYEKNAAELSQPVTAEYDYRREEYPQSLSARASMEEISGFFSRDCRRYDRAFQIF